MEGLLVNGLLAFVAGMLLNFTPCVLPVVPLKVRAVLQEIKGDARSRWLAAGALLLGSLTFFILLGGAFAYLGWKWGEIFQSKIFLSVLSVFLLLAGIAMLANWTFRLPQIVYKIPIHRYLGAFLTGVLAGILSTPCSGPFLGSVLAYAVTQPPAVIITLFVAVGVGLAFPYSAILLFPKAVNFLPRGNRVAKQIESILAFVLIAGAIFFGQSMIPDVLAPILWWAFVSALIAWGISECIKGKKRAEYIAPAVVLGLVVLGLISFFNKNGKDSLDWQPYSPSAFEQTLRDGKPVLLEFTADWCINCKVLEKTTYSSGEVIEAVDKASIKPFQVDMTDFREEEKTLLDHYGGEALPYAVLLNRSGETVQTYSGMFSAESLVKEIFGMSTVSAKSNNHSSHNDWKPQEGLSMIGTPAPEWQDIKWLQGGPVSLAALRGKVILLRFWLTSCPYCIASAPALNEFWETYHDRGLMVIGLHHPKSERTKQSEVVRGAAKELGFRFPIGMDNSWKTIRSYGVGSLFKNFTSVTFLIDQKGIIRFVHDGGEFHRTDDPEHQEHQEVFDTLDRLIERLLRNES